MDEEIVRVLDICHEAMRQNIVIWAYKNEVILYEAMQEIKSLKRKMAAAARRRKKEEGTK